MDAKPRRRWAGGFITVGGLAGEVALQLTGYTNEPLGLVLAVVAALAALAGLWLLLADWLLPKLPFDFRSPVVRRPKVPPLVASGEGASAPGQDMRALVKEWHYSVGRKAFVAARDLVEKLAADIDRGGSGALLCESLRAGTITPAWNSLGPFERALNGESPLDRGLLLDWFRHYGDLITWAGKISVQLSLPGGQEGERWKLAHGEMIPALDRLLARDLFDNVRQQALLEPLHKPPPLQ